MEKYCIGLGVQKSASTWLYRMLGEHPEIFVSTTKEIDFFSYYYDRGWQWYGAHFSACFEERVIAEVSPSYFHDALAPERMKRHIPDAKLVVMLRDPIERAYSNFLHDVRLGFVSGENLTFDAWLKNNPMYVEQGLYGKHLQRWLEYFPLESILIIFQDDVQKDPVKVSSELYRFLGVDDNYISLTLNQRDNTSYVPKNRRLDWILRKGGDIARKSHLGVIAAIAKEVGLRRLIEKYNSEPARDVISPMKEETYLMLQRSFEPDLVRLAELSEKAIPSWMRKFGAKK